RTAAWLNRPPYHAHIAQRITRGFDLTPRNWTVQNWRIPATLMPKEGIRHEKVQVHRRADCVCATSGRHGCFGRRGLPQGRRLAGHLLRVEEEVRRRGGQ